MDCSIYPEVVRVEYVGPIKRRRRAVQERTDVAIPERHVNMSNALARGAHALTLTEKRIVSMALALTDSVPAKDLFDAQRAGWVVRIVAQDYADTYEVDPRTAYEQLKESARGLLKRRWKTVHRGPRGLVFREGLWVSLVEYSEGEGYVSVRFTPEVAPHLLALRKEFTSYKLKQASALRSIYAWRLLECLQSWNGTGKWEPTIEEFEHAMDAPESCRKDFGRLRARIIEPAVRELRQKDNLLIEWKPVKAGRKVIGLVFTFGPDPQARLPL
jgi:plasmid replication initiation protein